MCGHIDDTIHVLRDCAAARQVWQVAVPHSNQNRFCSQTLHSRLLSNICSPLCLQERGVFWANLFGIVCWNLWKNRNMFLLQNTTMMPLDIIKTSESWSRHFTAYHKPLKLRLPLSNHAGLMSNKAVHLFTDGQWSAIMEMQQLLVSFALLMENG